MTVAAELAHLAVEGADIAVRVTPKASREAVEAGADGTLRLRVTAAPEKGAANRAARRLLAKALGVAPTRLEQVRGATTRDKVFRLR